MEMEQESNNKAESEGFFPFQQLNRYPIQGGEEIMSNKEHGTTKKPVQ